MSLTLRFVIRLKSNEIDVKLLWKVRILKITFSVQNRDGFIDKEDLHDMLASLGKDPTDEYLVRMTVSGVS